MSWYQARQLVAVDESHNDNRTKNRSKGISKRGTKAIARGWFHKGQRLSVLGVLAYDVGFIRQKIVKGGFNKERFEEAIETELVRRPTQRCLPCGGKVHKRCPPSGLPLRLPPPPPGPFWEDLGPRTFLEM